MDILHKMNFKKMEGYIKKEKNILFMHLHDKATHRGVYWTDSIIFYGKSFIETGLEDVNSLLYVEVYVWSKSMDCEY